MPSQPGPRRLPASGHLAGGWDWEVWMRRTADMTVSIYWNTRAKRWEIVARGGDAGKRSEWQWLAHADTTTALDGPAGWRVVRAIVDELESQLPF